MAATWTLNIPDLPQISAESVRLSLETHNTGDDDECIIGADASNRIDPNDSTNGGRYRSIVKIQSRFNGPDGGIWMTGTGWLVRSDTLITAGHVVYDREYGYGACTQIKCHIGFKGVASVMHDSDGQARYGQHVITTENWATPTSYGLNDRSHDVAFIRVHKPFEGDLRLFKFSDTKPPQSLMIVGYPGDEDLEGEKGAEMYDEFVRTAHNVDEDELYMITTSPGQSGAPITAKAKDGLVVVGTHCYGAGHGILRNSGNSIGGKWGNPYSKYLDLINNPTSFASRTNEIELVSLDSVEVGPILPVNPVKPPAGVETN